MLPGGPSPAKAVDGCFHQSGRCLSLAATKCASTQKREALTKPYTEQQNIRPLVYLPGRADLHQLR